MTSSTDRPFDVEIGAAVRARRVRFGRVPETDVELRGRLGDGSGSQTTRENVPEEIEPGVTYRDVRVRWRAGARVIDPDMHDRARKES